MTSLHKHCGRRDFLRRAARLSALAGTPFAANLASIGAAAAQTATDYKALVCVFLLGGNDQSNTVVPMDAGAYATYQSARPTLAHALSSLVPLSLQGYSGPPLGLHPALVALEPLFGQGRCALMANVGTLVQPTTLAQYKAGTVSLPQGLFSHADQQGSWQTGLPDRGSATGWLGRIGDLTASAYNPGSNVSICLSMAGNNIMQAGTTTIQYQLTTQGPVLIDTMNPAHWRYNATMSTAMQRMSAQPRAHLFETAYASIGIRALAVGQRVTDALAVAPAVTTVFPGSSLAAQLKMVARMIAARSGVGHGRQIFYVTQGGYDFHDNLVNDQQLRLKDLGDALAAFYAATEELGVAANVTTFTASDFGRGLQYNGRGTDHGWGSHHFVLGAAVNGNRVYGQFPTVALGGPEDAGQGRLLPTTPVDRYAATLASWFGVAASDLPLVLPNLGRFVSPAAASLGFV